MGVARPGGVVIQPVLVGDQPWVTAWISAQAIVKTTVALLAIFNLVVATEAWN